MTWRAIALAVLAVAWSCAAQAAPRARLDTGEIEGATESGLNVFRGVPFAAPPVGPLRWRPTQPHAPWTGIRPTTRFGPACPQPNRPDGAGGGRADHQDEDCLTLNVWAPENARGLPVMVWIHGGAHRLGASSFAIYDGAALARQGVILVSINYRLGLLGYFAHPALTAEAGPNAPLGNYGFMDQIAALEWVRRNIAALGGDPANVTVFGESAGGASILNLLANPRARGLFQRAIVQSGGGISQPATLQAAEQAGSAAAQSLGLPLTATAEQLRARPATDWIRAQGPLRGLGFGPFIDGRLITESPTRAFFAGRAIDVPLMIGANSNEASVLGALGGGPRLEAVSQGDTAAFRAAYGPGDDAEIVRQALGDAIFVAPARFVARTQAAGAPVYLYHFSYIPVVRRGRTPGAGHGSEIPYVFQSFNRIPLLAAFVRPPDAATGRTMSACWIAFARTGRPACEGAPDWPAYTAADDALMEFGPEIAVRRGFRRTQLDFIMGRMAAMGSAP